ncbi:MAG: PHP domain-containing protein [archaeon]|nr:PHP domain-containing protein [archaeon]
MKADLHVHTNYSSDGKSTPQQVLERCLEIGIGCIAITDHNEFRAFDDIKNNGKIIVIPAEEVSSSKGHIIAFGIDRHIPRGMGIQETINAIHEAGGYAIAAHPYRWWSGIGKKNTVMYNFDAIEALNARSIRSANIKSRKLAECIGKPVTAGSDAHSIETIGRGYVKLPDKVETWQEAVTVIMGEKLELYSTNRKFLGTLRYGFKSIFQWIFRGFRKM